MGDNSKKPGIRFKGFTDDWEQRKFADYYKMSSGYAFKMTDYCDDGAGLINGESIQHGIISDDNLNHLPESFIEQYPEFVLKEGDIVVGLNRPITNGNLKIARIPSKYNNFMLYQRAGKIVYKAGCDKDFSYILLSQEILKHTLVEAVGSDQPFISTSKLDKWKIMMPMNIEEQEKIGVYFSNLDHIITLHQRKYDKLVVIKKSMLEKMFPKDGQTKPEIRFSGFTDDWEQRKLGDVVIDHNAGIYISKEDYGKGTNVIGVGNIYDSDIFDGEIYRLGPVNDDKFILEENDIIYGESSIVPEGIARTVCIGKNGAGSAFAWHTRRVKLDKNVVNSHVATLELNYLHDIRKYLVSVSTQTALTGMTTDGYFGATLTLPSIQEQQKISDYFKQLDHLITLHQRELEKLKKIKLSMLEKMFV